MGCGCVTTRWPIVAAFSSVSCQYRYSLSPSYQRRFAERALQQRAARSLSAHFSPLPVRWLSDGRARVAAMRTVAGHCLVCLRSSRSFLILFRFFISFARLLSLIKPVSATNCVCLSLQIVVFVFYKLGFCEKRSAGFKRLAAIQTLGFKPLDSEKLRLLLALCGLHTVHRDGASNTHTAIWKR